ncbi:hypothetical protein H5410_020042 [Solanum commersonii]|uniref:Uncharacterized protein n=1 Tax=Solanum commersonii TaxID=4109 RepID=A0A9J5Z7A2_SOLCO|nr:hypothetical protein H5410_020042 [Solanum commersonii]
MKAPIISCLLISLFIHDLVTVDKFSSSLCVEAKSLSRFSYDELFNSQDKDGGRLPTPSPPNPNMRVGWKPIPPPP